MNKPKQSNLGKILVVEDNPDHQLLIQLILEEQGYSTVCVSTGEEALSAIMNSKDNSNAFEIILLDIMLPGMSGIEVLQKINAMSWVNETPVLMVSAVHEYESAAIEEGAQGFIEKPYLPSELISKIDEAIRLKKIKQAEKNAVIGLSALQKSAQAITKEKGLKSVLNSILIELMNVIKYDSASIVLKTEGRLEIAAMRGFRAEVQNFSSEVLNSLPTIQDVLHESKPIVIQDTDKDDKWKKLAEADYVHSWMGCPLIFKGMTIGVLNVDSEKRNFFTNEHLDIVSSLASQAAAVIYNTQAIQSLERNSKLASLLVKLSRELTSTRNLHHQLKQVLGFVTDHLSAPMFYVALYDEIQDVMNFEISYEMGEPIDVPSVSLKNKNDWGLAGYTIKTGNSLSWVTKEEREKLFKELDVLPYLVGEPSQSCIINPLEIGGKIIGALSVQSNNAYAWNDVERSSINSLSALVSVSIQNARLYNLVLERNQILEKVYSDTKHLTAELNFDQILKETLRIFTLTMNAASASIVLVNENLSPESLVIVGLKTEKSLQSYIRKDGLSIEVMRNNAPLFITDSSHCDLDINQGLIRDGVKAAASLPIQYEGKTLGVMWIHFDHTKDFSEEEKETLKRYAIQTAIAIGNAQNYKEIQIEKKQIDAINDINLALSNASNIDEAFSCVTNGAVKLFDTELITLVLTDNQSEDFTTSSFPEENKHLRVDPRKAGGVTAEILRSGNPVIINDTTKDIRVNPTVVQVGVRSFIGYPLFRKGIKGVLYLSSTKTDFFGGREIYLVSMLVTLTLNALDRIENNLRYKERLNKLELLAKASNKMMQEQSSHGFHKRMKIILEQLARILNAEATTLFRVKKRGTLIKVATHGQISDDVNVGMEFVIHSNKKGGGLTGYFGSQENIVNLDKKEIETHWAASNTEATHLKSQKSYSVLTIPLIKKAPDSSNELIGMLEAENKLGSDITPGKNTRFTKEDEWILTIFAESAVICIENAELFEKTSDKLQRRMVALTHLHETGKAITESLSLTTILERIVVQARNLTGLIGSPAESCYLALVFENSLRLYGANANNHLTELVNQIDPVGLNDESYLGIVQSVAKTGKSILLRDTSIINNRKDIPINRETRSVLAVPIVADEKVIGVIAVEHSNIDVFNEDDQEVLQALADEAAIAIINARRYDEQKKLVNQVSSRTQVAWMGMASAIWGHSIEGFAITIRDETELLRKDIKKEGDLTRHNKRLDKILRLANEIITRPITPPLSNEENISHFSISRFVRERVKQLTDQQHFKSIDFQFTSMVEDSVTVNVSSDWISRVVDLILQNASTAMQDTSKRSMKIKSQIFNGGVEIWFTDSGIGVPAEVQEKLFVEKIDGSKGFGIGLLTAQIILQMFNGEIYLKSSVPGETTFCIWLPILKS